jgi:hypothetical protein
MYSNQDTHLPSRLRSFAPQLHHAEDQCVAGNAEQSRNANVSPSIVSLIDVHCLQIVCAGSVCAIFAQSAVVRVGDVSGVGVEELRHVFSTCCARGQRNLCELIWPALDLDVVDHWLEEAADEVCKRIQVVHLYNACQVSGLCPMSC